MFDLRVKYPNSVWGKLRTWVHNVKGCNLDVIHSRHGGVVVYDDSCRTAWWA